MYRGPILWDSACNLCTVSSVYVMYEGPVVWQLNTYMAVRVVVKKNTDTEIHTTIQRKKKPVSTDSSVNNIS